MDVKNSTFYGNHAPYGGALRGPFNIYDSEFDSNTATDGNGGAIDVATDAGLAYGLVLEFVNSPTTMQKVNAGMTEPKVVLFTFSKFRKLTCIIVYVSTTPLTEEGLLTIIR